MSFLGAIGRKGRKANTHVIVCGNEKGGSGKTTLAMHIAVALLRSGHSVATIDLDSRQLSFTRHVENRRHWAERNARSIPMPTHFHVAAARYESLSASEAREYEALAEAMASIEGRHDFVVIDTPGSDTHLNRLAHSMADTLVTPINDSFVDFDVLARIDPLTLEIRDLSQYALAVRNARRERRNADGGVLDWIVVRNRVSTLSSRNEQAVDRCVRKLSQQLGFRVASGISERVIYREFFPLGLTAVDELTEDIIGTKPTLSHLAARHETRALVEALKLPVDDKGRKQSAMRRDFLSAVSKPVALPDIFAD